MRSRAIPLFFVAAAVLSGPVSVVAQEAAPGAQAESSVLRLFYDAGELVTTATRTPEEARLAPATVEVFTAEDIENMGARKLSDLLRTLESVYVSVQTNSRESLWIRGIRNRYNDKVLLMVDGIPRRDPVYQNAAVDEYLPLANVERVEVIRGPGSALYGTNAFAGVINVITKRASSSNWGKAEVGGGDYRTVGGSVEGAFRWGAAGIFAYADGYRTDGDGLDFERHHYRQVLRQDPRTRVSGGVTLDWGDFEVRLERLHYYHTYITDWDVPTWRWKDEGYWYDDTFASAKFARDISTHTRVEALAYYQDYDSTNFWREFIWGRQGSRATPDDVGSEIDVVKKGRHWGADLQFTFELAASNRLTAGATYERESVSSVEDLWTDVHTGANSRPFYIDPVGISTWALYVEDIWKPKPWVNITAGVRGDHNGIFGWKTSPRLGVTVHPGDRLVAKLLYGEAFRAPSFREFFTVDRTGQFPAGNPALKPEGIRTLEASLEYTFSSYVAAHLHVYQERTTDAIFSEQNLPYANHPGATVEGFEAGVKFAWPNRIKAFINGSHIRTDQYNVPKTLANAGINYPFRNGWNWNLQAQYVSSRPRDPEDRYSYDTGRPPYRRPDVAGYILVDTTLRLLQLKEGLELRLSVHNLFDRDIYDPTYEPTKYYDIQAPGRTFLVKVVYRF